MIVQCPQCQARYQLAPKLFGGWAELQLRCTKCQTPFSVKGLPSAQAPAAQPVPPTVPDATVVSKGGGGLPVGKSVSLSVTNGRLQGTIFPITKPRVVLGRAEADILIADTEVSRKHCALEVQGTTALLVDLGSANGTLVEGQKIQSHELHHLSEFRIGATTLMFTVTDQE